MSPYELEAAMNLLAVQILDIELVIDTMSQKGHTMELYDLKKQRLDYIDSYKSLALKLWEIELEAQRAVEFLKLTLPGYLGVPCADYRVPNSLLKYCKLDYKDE